MVASPETAKRYRRRVLDDELDMLQAGVAAVAIEGAKAVGKTSTAAERAAAVVELDDPVVRDIVAADLDLALDRPAPLLIDEWQRLPAVWDRVRRRVDAGAAPGRYLLTGSASPADAGTHSGAGRIIRLLMRPLAMSERQDVPPTVSLSGLLRGSREPIGGECPLGLADYTQEILRSGFPGIRDLPARSRAMHLDAYLQRVVDRDFSELGHNLRNPDAVRRWMTAYAAATATTATWETILDAASAGHSQRPTRRSVAPYRDVLQRLFLLDDLPGWQPSRNHLKVLATAPKHHLADPALAARLLRATPARLLNGDPVGPAFPRDGALLGRLFESLVTLSVRVYAQACLADVFHCRAYQGGHEVDLIVEGEDGIVGIEVKLGPTPDETAVRHLKWLESTIGGDLADAVVVTTGPQAYRRPDGIAVVPLALLGP